MNGWEFREYCGEWRAFAPFFVDGWDDEKRHPSEAAARAAVEKFILFQTEEGRQAWRMAMARTFWERAKCTHSYPPTDKRFTAERAEHGRKLVRVRRYKDPETGEVRKTIELLA